MDIPKDHVAALSQYFETERVRYFQQGWGNGLKVNGIYGTETSNALDDYLDKEVPATSAQEDPGTPAIRQAFDSAKRDVGNREDPMGSNGGPYIEALRREVNLPRLAGGEWCAVFQSAHLCRYGIPAKSRGAPGVVREMIELPGGREVDIEDIGDGFVGLAVRKRGRKTHHVQIFRAFMTGEGMRIEHVGGNEKHQVQSKIWKPAKFFKGVVRVGTYA